MNWLDVIIIFVIFVSTSLSFFRGLLKEVLSLVSWFLAIFLASLFHPSLAYLLKGAITSPAVRAPLAFATLFLLTFVLCHFLSVILRGIIAQTGLTNLDRGLGSLFGFARGALLVVLTVGLFRWFNIFVQESWWQSSALVPYAEHLQDWADAITQSIGLRLARD
jgi:membrane protein required for colicin V production